MRKIEVKILTDCLPGQPWFEVLDAQELLWYELLSNEGCLERRPSKDFINYYTTVKGFERLRKHLIRKTGYPGEFR